MIERERIKWGVVPTVSLFEWYTRSVVIYEDYHPPRCPGSYLNLLGLQEHVRPIIVRSNDAYECTEEVLETKRKDSDAKENSQLATS